MSKQRENERGRVMSGNELPVLVSHAARPRARWSLKTLIEILVIVSFLLGGLAAALVIYDRIAGVL